MDKLPQELIDKIIGSIDRIGSDPYHPAPSLLACSCVCRSWRRQAQKGIFLHVGFIHIDQLRRWDRSVSLESEVPSYVHHLHWAVWSAREEPPDDPFLENTFPGCFASFSNIKTLSVANLSLRPLDNAAIERTFSRMGLSLRYLRINSLATDPEKLCFLTSLLPNLKHLCIYTATMSEGERGPSQDNPPSLDFTGHISFYTSGTEQFFHCIAGLRPRFEGLEVRDIGRDLADTFNLVVKNCSATLTTISINPGLRLVKGVEAMTWLDLSPCRNLRILRIQPLVGCLPALPAISGTISSRRFEKLIVGPTTRRVVESLGKSDQVLCSFAERLYKLGAVKPLTVVLELPEAIRGWDGVLDVRRVWPLFCKVGVIHVTEY